MGYMKRFRALLAVSIAVLLVATPVFAHSDEWTIEDIKRLGKMSESAILDSAVYVTDTGEKYHRWGCHYLISCNPEVLVNAIENGYTPCSYCKPPQIPDSYYAFRKMDASGELNTVVYTCGNGNLYHRKECPKIDDGSTEILLCDAHTNEYSACQYCNPPKLTNTQKRELMGLQSSPKIKDWLDNPILTTLLVFIALYLSYWIIIYVKDVYNSLKKGK